MIVVATEGDEEINKIADCIIRVPESAIVFSPITASVPLQLLRARGRHPARLRRRPAPQPGKKRHGGVVGSAVLATKARLRIKTEPGLVAFARIKPAKINLSLLAG